MAGNCNRGSSTTDLETESSCNSSIQKNVECERERHSWILSIVRQRIILKCKYVVYVKRNLPALLWCQEDCPFQRKRSRVFTASGARNLACVQIWTTSARTWNNNRVEKQNRWRHSRHGSSYNHIWRVDFATRQAPCARVSARIVRLGFESLLKSHLQLCASLRSGRWGSYRSEALG